MASFSRSTLTLVTGLVVALVIQSCGGGDGPGPMQPPTTGTLRATVTADGTPRQGVTVSRYATGGATATATATTGSDGVATFSNVDPGSWDVGITVPTGFTLDTGETDRKAATVVAGQTANATFALVDTFMGETIDATDGLTFSRPNVTISAGTAVRWVNTGAMLHTVTPDGHSEWTAANLATTGASFTHTFNTPGTYEYYCDPHVGSGMTGTITVN
jgi:plastocyanin